MKNYIGYIVIAVIIALNTFSSCNNEVKEEPKPIEIDSLAVRDSMKQLYSLKLKKEETADFILDSVALRYSIDGNLILNKNVLIEVRLFDDIYKDNNQIHLIINDYDKYIDLTCTPEQLDSLNRVQKEAKFQASNNSTLFLTFKPNYVKKINQEYVSNSSPDDDPETKDESFIEIDSHADRFKIKGSLINFKIYQYE